MSLRKFVKRVGRSKTVLKISRVSTPLLGFAATAVGGPVAGELVALGGAAKTGYLAGANARGRGMRGQAVGQRIRAERKRTFLLGQVGVGAGLLGSVLVGGFGAAPLGLGGQALLNGGAGSGGGVLGSGQGFLGLHNPFISATPLQQTFGGVTAADAASASKLFGGGVKPAEVSAASKLFGSGVSPAEASKAAAAFSAPTKAIGGGVASDIGSTGGGVIKALSPVAENLLKTYLQPTPGHEPGVWGGGIPTNPAEVVAGGGGGDQSQDPESYANTGPIPGGIPMPVLIGAGVLAAWFLLRKK